MSDFARRQETLARVVALVADDPEQLAHVIAAATEGQRLYTKQIRDRLSAVDLAWRAVLAMDGQRLTPGLRDSLERAILPVLEGDLSLCEAERRMRDKLRLKAESTAAD